MQSLFTILDAFGVQFYNDSIYQTKTLSPHNGVYHFLTEKGRKLCLSANILAVSNQLISVYFFQQPLILANESAALLRTPTQ